MRATLSALLCCLALSLPLSPAAHAEETTAYTEAELLAAVQRHAPERFVRLMKLKDTDPERYLEALATVEDLLREKEGRKSERQALLEEMKARRDALVVRYDAARTDRQRAEIRAELEVLAREYLLLRLELREERLESARARLETMEAELAQQRDRIDELAAEFVTEGLERRTPSSDE